MTSVPSITGLVLAGGLGRRMGGQDKGLLLLQERPLAAHVLDALRPQVAALLINANRNLERYRELRVPVVADPVPDYPGPLAGFLAGLSHIKTDWLLAVACDMPVLPADLAARLLAGALGAQAPAAYAVAAGEAQYTCCLLNRSLIDALRERLQRRERAVHQFLAAVRAAAVPFETWPALARNLNTPAELERAAAGSAR